MGPPQYRVEREEDQCEDSDRGPARLIGLEKKAERPSCGSACHHLDREGEQQRDQDRDGERSDASQCPPGHRTGHFRSRVDARLSVVICCSQTHTRTFVPTVSCLCHRTVMKARVRGKIVKGATRLASTLCGLDRSHEGTRERILPRAVRRSSTHFQQPLKVFAL